MKSKEFRDMKDFKAKKNHNSPIANNNNRSESSGQSG